MAGGREWVRRGGGLVVEVDSRQEVEMDGVQEVYSM